MNYQKFARCKKHALEDQMKGEAKFFASLKEISEKRQKKPSAIPKIWVPRVNVLNYLKKVAHQRNSFICFSLP
jgi:hypothetical protein